MKQKRRQMQFRGIVATALCAVKSGVDIIHVYVVTTLSKMCDFTAHSAVATMLCAVATISSQRRGKRNQ